MAKIRKTPVDAYRLTPEDIANLHQLETMADEEVAAQAEILGIPWSSNPQTIDLSLLPADRRRFFTDQMDQIRHLHETMTEQGVPPFVRPPLAEGSRVSPSDRGFASYPGGKEGELHANDVFYARNNLQYRPEEGPALWDQYRIGTPRRYRVGYEQEIADQLNNIRAGGRPFNGKVMVLDTETAGLDTERGIRSLGWRIFDDNMKEVGREVMHFQNNFFKWGTVGTQSLEDFAKDKLGVGGYTDTKEGIKGFLKAAKDTDFQISAYNAPFDLGHLIATMKRHAAYVDDPEFKGMVDEFVNEMGQSGKMFDIADMIRVALGLDLAPELAAKGAYTPASHSNVLLQSNILRVLHAEGEDPKMIQAALSGLHQEDYDVWLESRILKYMDKIRKEPLSRRRYGNEVETISRSTAWAPGIRLPAANVDPALRGFLEAHGVLDEAGAKITAYEHMILQMRQRTPTNVFTQRSDPVAAADAWRNFTTNVLDVDENGLIKPTGPGLRPSILQDHVSLQEKLIENGSAYPELSAPERLLSVMASGGDPVRSLFSGAIPQPTFYGAERARVAGFNGEIPIIPADILNDVIGEDASRLITMDPLLTKGGIKDIAYKLHPEEEDLNRILEFLRRPEGEGGGGVGLALTGYEDYGISAQTAEALHKAISEGGGVRGIQIGTKGRLQGTTEARKLYDVAKQQAGGTVEGSYSGFGVVRGAPITAEQRGKLIPTGPVLSTTLHDEAFVSGIESQIGHQGLTLTRLAEDATRNPSMLNAAKATLGEAEGAFPRRASIIAKTDKFYDTFGRKAIIGGAVLTAGAVAGKIAYNKYRERKMANEPVMQQSTQIGRLYNSLPTDYLSTAGVTRVLDEQRSGHHRMGSNKNSHLF